MKLDIRDRRTQIGLGLVALGLLALLGDLGVFAGIGRLFGLLLFGAAGLIVLRTYRDDPSRMWTLPVGFGLLGLAVASLDVPWGGGVFLASIGLGFLAVWLSDEKRDRWWALIPAGVLLTLDEPETYKETATEELSLRRTVRIVRDVLARRRLRAFLLYYYVLYAAVTYLVFVFLQPIFETVVLDLGVPQSQVEALLGWFYAAYSLVGAVLNYYTGTIRETIGLRMWFLVLPFAVGGALIGMYLLPVLALPTFLLIRGVSDVTRSFAGQYINDRVETLGRATVLSAMAMVSGLAVVPFQLGSGVVSDAVSPLFALGVGGVVLVVGAAAILLWEVPIGDESVQY